VPIAPRAGEALADRHQDACASKLSGDGQQNMSGGMCLFSSLLAKGSEFSLATRVTMRSFPKGASP
jgi:hypothetical protein